MAQLSRLMDRVVTLDKINARRELRGGGRQCCHDAEWRLPECPGQPDSGGLPAMSSLSLSKTQHILLMLPGTQNSCICPTASSVRYKHISDGLVVSLAGQTQPPVAATCHSCD